MAPCQYRHWPAGVQWVYCYWDYWWPWHTSRLLQYNAGDVRLAWLRPRGRNVKVTCATTSPTNTNEVLMTCNIYSHHSPASAQYWTSSRVAGTLSLDTSLGFPKTRQLTKHSGVTSTYLSDTFLIKAGGAVRAAQATNGLTRSAGTTTTYHQLICGGEVIRGWRYGPCRYVLTTTTTTSHIWAFNVHNHRQDVWHLKTSIQCFDAAGRMESHPTLNGSPTIPEVHSSPFRDSA